MTNVMSAKGVPAYLDWGNNVVMDNKNSFAKDTLGWGLILWFIGWMLGIVLFMLVPPDMIGWIITPVASVITVWVLVKKIKSDLPSYYLAIAVIWTVMAVVLDYLFIVLLFHPEDGYYKLDIYIYYGLTFLLPLAVGLWKRGKAMRGG